MHLELPPSFGEPQFATLATYYKLTKQEDRWAGEHITIEQFSKALDKRIERAQVQEISVQRKELSKQERAVIREDVIKETSRIGIRGYCKNSEIASAKANPALFIRAIKKETTALWSKWYQTKSDIDKGRAMQLQAILDTVQSQGAIMPNDLFQLSRSGAAISRVFEQFLYLSKKESPAALKGRMQRLQLIPAASQ